MDDKTEQIECLNKSINEKWIPIVEGRHRNRSGEDCACCQEYDYCIGCPVAEDIGENCGDNNHLIRGAESSSYWAYVDLSWGCFERNSYNLMFDLKAAAQMELDYLIGLRNRLAEEIEE